jgi:polysaccharide biosynthesis transport protein
VVNSEIRPASPAAQPPGVPDVISLGEVLSVLRRHWILIAMVTATVFAVAAALALGAEPEYRARAVIRLQDQRQALTGGLGAEAVEQVLGKQNDPLLSQVQVLRSRAVAGDVVAQTGLRLLSQTPQFPAAGLAGVLVERGAPESTLELRFREDGFRVTATGGEALRAPYGQRVRLSGVAFTVPRRPDVAQATLAVLDHEDAVDRLLERLRATPREKTDVVDVEFTSTSSELARDVVNAVVTTFQRINARTAQQQAVRRRTFVEEQLAETDSVLAGAQSALTAYREQQQVFGSQQQVLAEQEGLRGVDLRRNELESDLRVSRSLMQRLRLDPAEGGDRELRALMSAPGIATNPVITQLYGQLVRYRTTLDSLTAGEWGSAATDPQVQRLTALAAAARASLLEAVGGHVSALEARLVSLDELRRRASVQLSSMPATEAEEARLLQRLETVRSVAEQLRSEYQRARIAEAVEAGQVQIVDLASRPREPLGSGRGLKLALGLVLGLMLGSGMAFVREHLNTAIRPEEVEARLRTPVLSIIPKLSPGRPLVSGLAPFSRNGRRSEPHAAAGAAEFPELAVLAHPRSPGAEAFRRLRTNLLFTQAARTLRTLVVTSASPAEGKTTTTANLAIAFARQGMKVLLVDCDLRKPRMHVPFGVPREPGITELVLGYASVEDLVRSTTVERLSLLPSGTLPPDPSEFLGSARMAEVLRELGAGYDLVLIDTPPVLAASDSTVLAARVDGTLLVLRAGSTDRGAAEQALRQLTTVGGRVLGAVLNDPDAQIPKGGGYHSYYYAGYYGESPVAEPELAGTP